MKERTKQLHCLKGGGIGETYLKGLDKLDLIIDIFSSVAFCNYYSVYVFVSFAKF